MRIRTCYVAKPEYGLGTDPACPIPQPPGRTILGLDRMAFVPATDRGWRRAIYDHPGFPRWALTSPSANSPGPPEHEADPGRMPMSGGA